MDMVDLAKSFMAGANASKRVQSQTVSGLAVSDSEDGRVTVQVAGTDVECACWPSVKEGQAVTVTVVNRRPVVTGVAGWGDAVDLRVASLAADIAYIRQAYIDELVAGSVTADRIAAAVAYLGTLEAKDVTADVASLAADIAYIRQAYIDELVAGSVTADRIAAAVAYLGTLEAKDVTAESIVAATGYVGELDAASVTTADLTAASAMVSELEAKDVTADMLVAASAYVGGLVADEITVGRLTAALASVDSLSATYAKIDWANVGADMLVAASAYVGGLVADEITVGRLTAALASVDSLSATYAKIDWANVGVADIGSLLAKSGIIGEMTTESGTVTGTLVGVTIKGDLIKGGTVVADKLVMLGEDGLYYRLNTDGETVTGQQTDYNSLNGSHIQAQSVTADKISVTDLVAFGATIGGVVIGDGSLHSFGKETLQSPVSGFFLGSDGSMSLGDSDSYIRYDAGSHDLAVKVDELYIGSERAATEARVDSMRVGGTNLAIDSAKAVSNADYMVAEYHISANEGSVLSNGYGHLVAGRKYTVTVDATFPAGVKHLTLFSDQRTPMVELSTSGEGRQRISKTFTARYASGAGPTDDLKYATVRLFRFPNPGSTSPVTTTKVTIHTVKIEAGNMPTSWSPAPEDMATSAELQVTADAITSKVGETEARVSTLEQTAEAGNMPTSWSPAPEDMATSAELQVTADAITSKVGETEARVSTLEQTADAITSKVGATDGKVSTLEQTADSLTVSLASKQDAVDHTFWGTLEQTADAITSKVGATDGKVSTLEQTADSLTVSLASKQDAVDHTFWGAYGRAGYVAFATVKVTGT